MEQTRDAQEAQDADHPDHTVDAAMPKSKACPLFGLRICEVKVVNLWKSMKRQACNTASHGRLRKRQAIPMDIDHFPTITSEWVSIGCCRDGVVRLCSSSNDFGFWQWDLQVKSISNKCIIYLSPNQKRKSYFPSCCFWQSMRSICSTFFAQSVSETGKVSLHPI